MVAPNAPSCRCGAPPVFEPFTAARGMYQSWVARCTNPNCKFYLQRGITGTTLDGAIAGWKKEVEKGSD